jgi:hypothetical protein
MKTGGKIQPGFCIRDNGRILFTGNNYAKMVLLASKLHLTLEKYSIENKEIKQ